jgi:hypothetical protein
MRGFGRVFAPHAMKGVRAMTCWDLSMKGDRAMTCSMDAGKPMPGMADANP